jgi:hypothetical protein
MPKRSPQGSGTGPTLAELQELRLLARSIIVAQGNLFIRELLREHHIRIGTNKAEFEQNLLEAIDKGEIRLNQLREWLDRVEGWGAQHVYLYHVPQQVLADPTLASARLLRVSLPKAQQQVWQSERALEFPERPTLTGIYFDDNTLRYVWQQAYMTSRRAPERDYEQELDGDLYEFRAYRKLQNRTVRRFVLRKDLAVAGIFIQTEWSEKEHADAISDVMQTINPIIPFATLQPFSISDVIKNLDHMSIVVETQMKAQRTRLTDAGAYVEFASTSDLGYKGSTAVRRVRNAVRPESFVGSNGTFIYTAVTPTGSERPVKFDVYGEQRRIKLRPQMTADQVWDLLQQIQRAEQWGRITSRAS